MLYSGIIKNNKRMNNSFENLENAINQLQQQLNELKTQCVVSEDPGPEIDSASFTKQELIEYTRTIQERTLEAVKEAVKGSCVDIESYVELDLYNRTIEINVDDDSIYSEIVSNIENAFETDDDSIWDEATNVIKDMK